MGARKNKKAEASSIEVQATTKVVGLDSMGAKGDVKGICWRD